MTASWWCSASSPASRKPASATSRSMRQARGRRSTCRASSKSRTSKRRKTYLALGQFLLEHRHLPVPRQHHARRLPGIQPGHLERASRRRCKPRRPRCPASICRGDLYAEVPSISIDYAIMERASGIAMVPRPSFRWNDLGSWQSLLDVSPSDADGNVIVGDVVAIDCENSYLRSDGRLLSAIGMKNVAIVSTTDATFVAPVSHSQNVKKIVEQLEKSGRLETKFTPAPDRVIAGGAWRKRVRPLAVRGDAAAVVGRSASTASMAASTRRWRFDGSAAQEAEAHAHHGAPGLCLRRRQGARLGRPGRRADRAWPRLHGRQGPHRHAAAGCARSMSTARSPIRSRTPTTIPACCWRWRGAPRRPSRCAAAWRARPSASSTPISRTSA